MVPTLQCQVGLVDLADPMIAEIGKFVDYYNHQWYHESLDNVIPADAYTGQAAAILKQREGTKRETTNRRRIEYRKAIAMRQTVS
jgi:putative transposase